MVDSSLIYTENNELLPLSALLLHNLESYYLCALWG